MSLQRPYPSSSASFTVGHGSMLDSGPEGGGGEGRVGIWAAGRAMGWLCDVHMRACAGAIDSCAPIGSKG